MGQPYGNQQNLTGFYAPPKVGEIHGAELDAGQGYQFTAEATTPNTNHLRAELQ
jgi:hypothetical protein